MATPVAKGLFHRVMTMSGQQIKGASIEIAAGRAKTVLAKMGIADGTGAVLRGKDLVAAIKRGVSAHAAGTAFLFDEIEKAHRAIIDIFISLLDEGQITDLDGSRISVGNCYLVLTSNIGAARWASMETTKYSRMESFAFEQARKVLRPELFNRITETIVFRPLSQEVQISILRELLSKKLNYLESRLRKRPLAVDDRANAQLLRKCFTQAEGARRLRQELDRQINLAALPWMLENRLPSEGRFYYEPKLDQLVLR